MIELTSPPTGTVCWFCSLPATAWITHETADGHCCGFGACDHIRHRRPYSFERWIDGNYLPTGEGRRDITLPDGNGIAHAQLFLRVSGDAEATS